MILFKTIMRYLYILLITAVIAFLIYFIWLMIQNSGNPAAKLEVMPNIDTLTRTSPYILVGTVTDEGKIANIGSDETIIPTTNYTVDVDEVYRGDISAEDQINLVLKGGIYEGINIPLQANITPGYKYVFFLEQSNHKFDKEKENYQGTSIPFIFEFMDGKLFAVSNEENFKAIFEEDGLSERVFLLKIIEARR